MGVRCGRRRRQRCALMKAKQRVPALRGGQPDDLASNRGSCDRISLRCASMRQKITLNKPGLWGMSVEPLHRKRPQRLPLCLADEAETAHCGRVIRAIRGMSAKTIPVPFIRGMGPSHQRNFEEGFSYQ